MLAHLPAFVGVGEAQARMLVFFFSSPLNFTLLKSAEKCFHGDRMENELRRKYESIQINEPKNGFGAGKPFICFVPASAFISNGDGFVWCLVLIRKVNSKLTICTEWVFFSFLLQSTYRALR